MTHRFGLAFCLLLAGCQPPAPAAKPHYVAGAAWQADGVWHYPQDSLELNTTGVATIYRGAPQLTTDGEVYDATALTAAQQTLALPAVARITNLDNGLQVMVRINDRGPTDPGRIVAVTPRVASLLQFGPDGLAPVRLDVLTDESRAVAGVLPSGGGPTLEVGLAPVGDRCAAASAGSRDAGAGRSWPRDDRRRKLQPTRVCRSSPYSAWRLGGADRSCANRPDGQFSGYAWTLQHGKRRRFGAASGDRCRRHGCKNRRRVMF
jgi:hypothetical protein